MDSSWMDAGRFSWRFIIAWPFETRVRSSEARTARELRDQEAIVLSFIYLANCKLGPPQSRLIAL